MSNAQPCPHCGDTYDDAAEFHTGRRRRPGDGDVGICCECLGVYVYELGAFNTLFRRLPNDAERARLSHRPDLMHEIRIAKDHIQRMKLARLTQREEDELKKTRTEAEWDAACDRIKAARDGDYPIEWFVKIIASGFLTKQKDKWKVSST